MRNALMQEEDDNYNTTCTTTITTPTSSPPPNHNSLSSFVPGAFCLRSTSFLLVPVDFRLRAPQQHNAGAHIPGWWRPAASATQQAVPGPSTGPQTQITRLHCCRAMQPQPAGMCQPHLPTAAAPEPAAASAAACSSQQHQQQQRLATTSSTAANAVAPQTHLALLLALHMQRSSRRQQPARVNNLGSSVAAASSSVRRVVSVHAATHHARHVCQHRERVDDGDAELHVDLSSSVWAASGPGASAADERCHCGCESAV